MVVTVMVNGEVIDEIQVENKGVSTAPYFTRHEWRSTKRVASGELLHHPDDGPHKLAAKALNARAAKKWTR